MYEGHPVKSFLMELLNALGVILLWLFKTVAVAVKVFAWVIILGCVFIKKR